MIMMDKDLAIFLVDPCGLDRYMTAFSANPRKDQWHVGIAAQDIEMLNRIRSEIGNPPLYRFFFNNCIHWANKSIDYGMDK